MRYLMGGAILFVVYLFNLIAIPRIAFPNVHPVPMWFSVIQGLIAILFVFFGVQAMRVEKKYFAGVLFLFLAVVAFVTLSLGNLRV